MGFATIGLFLFYVAFRYNLLFVNTSNIDTKGLIYPRALQHTLVGCYLSMICMIGLLAIRVAVGPLVLMIIFLVFCVIYHVLLSSALKPLIRYLPRSREEEQAALYRAEEGTTATAKSTDGDTLAEKDSPSANGKAGMPVNGNANGNDTSLEPPPYSKKNPLTKFLVKSLLHDKHKDLVNNDFAHIQYSKETESEAYYNPAVTAQIPLIWVPRDEMGISKEECAHTNEITPMTDEAAWFNEKGKIVWDEEGTNGRPPVYQEKIYY